MKIAVIGSGGVGGYFGGKLSKAGQDVRFLARGEHLSAMQKHGLKVNSILGSFKLDQVRASDNLEELGQVDLILLAVKAWQIKGIAPKLHKILHEGTLIIPLQNGVLALDELKESIAEKHLLGGLCRILSMIESPGVISHSGIEPSILLGEVDNAKTDRVRKVESVLQEAGIKGQVVDDIHAELWKKFIAICPSALLAVSQTSYGEMYELPETKQMMIDLLQEIYQVSQKVGINIESDFVEKTTAFIGTFPYNSTSSLTRDVLSGKPSEIEYQNGTVVRFAEKFGVDVPVNKFLYNCILPMEKKARAN